ncbi:hypothetical protein MAR_021040, partial [Mya arenaria]
MSDETSKFGSKYMGYEAADSTGTLWVLDIVATMSDKAATKVKFNTLLHDFRKDVLPLAIENYDAFSAPEKEGIENLCIFCGLHSFKCIKNVQSFMAGEMLAFGEDTHIDRDAIFNALLSPEEYDNCTEVLLATLCECSKNLIKDHLPGGVLTNLTQDMSDKVKSAPKSSSYAESVTTLATEACMSLNNKTTTWLNTKSDGEKKEIKKMASKSGSVT